LDGRTAVIGDQPYSQSRPGTVVIGALGHGVGGTVFVYQR